MREITLDGRIGKDAEIRTTSNGTKYVRFNLANSTYRNKEQKTEWFEISSYDPFIIDKMAPYLTKGKYIFVVGEIESVVSIKNTQVYLNHYITAHSIQFSNAGGKRENDGVSGITTTVTNTQVQAQPISQPQVEVPNPTIAPTINVPTPTVIQSQATSNKKVHVNASTPTISVPTYSEPESPVAPEPNTNVSVEDGDLPF